MLNKGIISKQTRNNWLVDTGLFCSSVIASLSGIYFLYLPIRGYKGGRNPTYAIEILFKRHTWEDLHKWAGILMIAIALIHIPLHWNWIVNMIRRILREIVEWRSTFKTRARLNLILNLIVGISFLAVAISGVYFFFIPGASQESGNRDPIFFFTQLTWDKIHTWGAVVFISAVILHFAIHWRWIVKVTGKMPIMVLDWISSRIKHETTQSA
jgi:hypothetical protein